MSAALICLFLICAAQSRAAVSTDDFVLRTPAQAVSPDEKAELREVKEPQKVAVTPADDIFIAPTITGGSASDAINTFLKNRTEGFCAVDFPGGIGGVATGVSVYDVFENNPVASRISKRQAYEIAYLNAKNQLTAWAEGQLLKWNILIGNRQTSLSDSDDNLNDILEKWRDFLEVGVEGVVRRHSVYDVYDDYHDPSRPRVYVTILSCPLLWGSIERQAPSTIAASSLESGLDTVFNDINNNLISPVGGKAIFVPETGELAYVGFGSDVVRYSENPAAFARMELNAERIARMRAQLSLLNMIQPNEALVGSMRLDELTLRSIQEINKLASGDVTETVDASNGSVFERTRQQEDLFRNSQEFKLCVDAANTGKLPPGIQQKSWLDDTKEFAYAVAVYIPSETFKVEPSKPSK